MVYDPAVLAYWIEQTKNGSKTDNGTVLRDVSGKKIQTQEEVSSILDAIKKEKESVGLGTKVAAYTHAVIYSPVVIARDIVSWVLSLPLLPFSLHDNKEYERSKKGYERAVEDAYASGRRHFDSGELETALTEWEHALIAMPSLRDFSDIYYRRGRALEARGETKDAQAAYFIFLSYSERSTPSFFKEIYPNDPTWVGKAEDVEKRIFGPKRA